MKKILLLFILLAPLLVHAQPVRVVRALPKVEQAAARGGAFKWIKAKPIKPFIYVQPSKGSAPVVPLTPQVYVPSKIPQPRVVKVDQAALQREVIQQERAKAAQERFHLINQVLLFEKDFLKGYTLPGEFIEGYYARRIQPYLAHPSYIPDAKSDKVLYRGMIITPAELATVLRDGFSPSNSHWNGGTEGGKQAVSLSSSMEEATSYIFQNGSKNQDALGIVFEVRRKPSMTLGKDEKLNSTKTIYYSYEDIPAEDIVGVSVFGEWGLESLDNVLEKIHENKVTPHTNWTGQFGSRFSR